MAYYSNELIKFLRTLTLFAYVRKSSEDNEDRQVLSIPGQKKEIEEQLIGKYGLKIAGYYEESQSAFKVGRPAFNEMLSRIEGLEAAGAISWHPNRFARNYQDGGRLVQLMLDKRLQIVLTCAGMFENNPRDRSYLMDEFTKATRDSDDKSEAVKRGNRMKLFERKIWVGPAKPGYLNFTDPLTKHKLITEDKNRNKMLSNAVHLILTGKHTPMEVLDLLNNQWNFRSRKTARQGGKPMAKSGFYKFLSDPYLYGLMVRREGEQMGKFKPMLEKEEFDKLQIILGRKGKARHTKHDLPYKQLLKCGSCGGSVTAEEKWQIICSNCKTKFHKAKNTDRCLECQTLIEDMKKPKILHYIHLHCTKRVHHDCPEGSIEINKLEKQVLDELVKYEIRPEFLEWAVAHINELNDSETETRQVSFENAQKALTDTEKRLDKLMDLYISPQNTDGKLLSEEELNKRRQPILQEKEDWIQKIDKLSQRQNNWHELTIRTFNFACYARYWFANGDIEKKLSIMAALGSNLTLKGKLFRINDLNPFMIIAEGKKEAEAILDTFEPNKKPEILSQIPIFEPLRLCMLPSRDSNPDKLVQSQLSYR